MTRIPSQLVDTIRSGDAIAFVGAGFTCAAELPSWRRLLHDLAAREDVGAARREHVRALLRLDTAHAFDEAAQIVEDALGRAALMAEMTKRLRPAGPLPEVMTERLRWLRGIPFRAIVTTNFDGILEGATPSAEAYRRVLRPEASNPWWKRLFHKGPPPSVPVIKIHGDVAHPETVVITRRDYRRLLYDNPGYQAFMRAVLANRPVLYLGFSFSDAYLNEMRSEILSLLGYGGHVPVAYAMINDVPRLTIEHYRKHEGIHILGYDTRGGTDFSGFDELLSELHDRTNPLYHFGTLLDQKRILWVDPNPDNNEHITAFFRLAKEVAELHPGSLQIELAADAEEAMRVFADAPRPFDVVITHWGHRQHGTPTAVRLLESMRREDVRAPVLVFSMKEHANERKPVVLGLGAHGYYFTNQGLLKAIERVLSPGVESG